jgi:hypothetical protein
MHIHPDIEVWDEKTTCRPLKLVTSRIAIKATKNHIAVTEGFRLVFPGVRKREHRSGRIYSLDETDADIYFTRALPCICVCRTNESVKVLVFDGVGINNNELADADVRQLLYDVGTSAPKPDHRDAAVAQYGFAVIAEKTLALKPIWSHEW